MSPQTETHGRGPGRPRKFERDPALDAAVRVFWQHGYEATGVAALREAMGGMPSASFYALFGSKADLFVEAMSRYRATHGRVLDPLTDEGLGPRGAVERTLRDSIRMQTDPGHPLGCMMVLAAATTDPGDRVYQVVSERRASTRRAIGSRVEEAVAEGSLPEGTDVAATVGLVYGFLLGISTQARDGVPADALQASVDALLSGWATAPMPPDAEASS